MHKKYKIFMLSDHPISSSGVGTQSRWLIDGLVKTGKYSFRCFGAAVKHQNYNTIAINEDFVIKPTDGFGTPDMIRQVLISDKPDAMLLFTDPRFFMNHFSMEDEIHQVCPITYNHLWDALPVPHFNKFVYESCDLVNCINHLTYEFVHDWFPEKTHYVPHAIPKHIYRPLSNDERMMWRKKLLGPGKENSFVVLFVGRNARRKRVSDILVAWKMFIEQNNVKDGVLLLHTDPLDQEGPNLYRVCDMLDIKDTVVFSKERIEFDMMNNIYNICDVQINASLAEGFGLPILEGKMTGLPAIATMTGGLTRQVKDHITGYEYGVAMKPDVISCVGNQMIPYINEDVCSNETMANALKKMYEMQPEKRQELRQKCIEHANRDYDIDSLISTWDRTLENTINNWRSTYKPWSCVEL